MERSIAVVGLGYVGLPVALAFGKRVPTIAFDINSSRVEELARGVDRNRETPASLFEGTQCRFTSDPKDLAKADFYIVAVPTPVDDAHVPDLSMVLKASETVAKQMRPGAIVVFESTVYPGATEEDCVPILEKHSGLRCGKDFTVGYSPERINPGDTQHTFETIRKVVAGQDAATLEVVARVYGSVVTAGVHRASSIKVAEAAKVIENTQRDLNIALMNELALVFHQLGVPTADVLEAAGTKWNFLPFRPGLVGGHCIGVDPYYLTYRAEKAGYIPQVILSGRRINDSMGKWIAQQTVKELIHAGQPIRGQRVTVLGLTFKENISDIRNSKVVDIIRELESFGLEVQVHDSHAYADEVKHEYGFSLVEWSELKPASAVVIAVAHEDYRKKGIAGIQALLSEPTGIVVDIKAMFPRTATKESQARFWQL